MGSHNIFFVTAIWNLANILKQMEMDLKKIFPSENIIAE